MFYKKYHYDHNKSLFRCLCWSVVIIVKIIVFIFMIIVQVSVLEAQLKATVGEVKYLSSLLIIVLQQAISSDFLFQFHYQNMKKKFRFLRTELSSSQLDLLSSRSEVVDLYFCICVCLHLYLCLFSFVFVSVFICICVCLHLYLCLS